MVSQFLLPRVRGQLRLFSAPTSHTINRCLLQQRIISTTIPRRAASTSTGAISNLPQFGGKSLPGFPTSNATGFRDSIRQLRGGRPFSSLPNLSANWDGAIRNNARNVDASAGGKDSPLERLAASWENELAAGVLDGKVMMDSKAQSSGTPPLPSGTPPPPSGNANFSGKEGESAGSDEKSENSEKKGWFAETNDRVVGVWLLGSAGLVFGIVVLGGLTRLTESGCAPPPFTSVQGKPFRIKC